MSRGVNKFIGLGNLGNDPELKFLPNGSAVVNFTLATSESWKDKESGQNVEKTEWHRCTAFGRLAEIIGEYSRKGSKVYVEGALRTRMWEKDGQKHYTTEIILKEFQMLDSRGEGAGSQSSAPQQQQQQSQPQQNTNNQNTQDFNEDIPF